MIAHRKSTLAREFRKWAVPAVAAACVVGVLEIAHRASLALSLGVAGVIVVMGVVGLVLLRKSER